MFTHKKSFFVTSFLFVMILTLLTGCGGSGSALPGSNTPTVIINEVQNTDGISSGNILVTYDFTSELTDSFEVYFKYRLESDTAEVYSTPEVVIYHNNPIIGAVNQKLTWYSGLDIADSDEVEIVIAAVKDGITTIPGKKSNLIVNNINLPSLSFVVNTDGT
ncbi:MAG: hypothetical protein WC002_09080, partial [Candidatus Muiribacteriota bacterium]